jgi:hypothetical protein
MISYQFFPYSWHIDEDEEEITSIRIYGLNEKNESISSDEEMECIPEETVTRSGRKSRKTNFSLIFIGSQ